jgi:hypothetical protein
MTVAVKIGARGAGYHEHVADTNDLRITGRLRSTRLRQFGAVAQFVIAFVADTPAALKREAVRPRGVGFWCLRPGQSTP